MRLFALAAAALLATAAAAQPPLTAPMAPAHEWHAKGRELYARAIEFETVAGRNQSPQMAAWLEQQFRAAGFTDVTVHRYEDTASLILRWPASPPLHLQGRGTARRAVEGNSSSTSPRNAILLLAHMDVVEALAEDWSKPPFRLTEEGGYFYGRGTSDDKQGVVGIAAALMRLRAEGFQPDRDIVVLFTGDEETTGRGADLAASEWLDLSTIDFALNADAGGGTFLDDGTLLAFWIQTAEKIYQSFTFTATNPGGHSSRPRPDNAIYSLAHALAALEDHRFEPMLNETTRAAFAHKIRFAEPEVAAAIRRWLADPDDGEAADIVEASDAGLGLTRTRCVATMLAGGHAENALPQRAQATVNCRIFPGVDPAAVLADLRALAAPHGVAVEPVDPARPSGASPLRDDVVGAYTAVVRARHPGAAIVPAMSAGATDGLFFRQRGVPVYGVSGEWSISPVDQRAHGRDERLPVRAFYDNIDHWTDLIRTLAGGGTPAATPGERGR